MARLFDDASSQYSSIASAVLSSTPLSISARFKTDDLSTNQAILAISDGVSDGWTLMFLGAEVGDRIAAAVYVSGSPFWAITTTGCSANTWHHGLAVFTSTTSRTVWLDGGGVGNDTTSAVPASVSRTDMGQLGVGAMYLSGACAEVAVWNAALTAADATVLRRYSPKFVRPENLVALWPCSRTDNDIVGGYHMTPYNSPTWTDHPPILVPAPVFYSIPAAVGGLAGQRGHRGVLRGVARGV